MKDTRTVIDAVRNKIPPGAKMLVAWIDSDGQLRASQANVSQDDVYNMAAALQNSAMTMPSGIIRAG